MAPDLSLKDQLVSKAAPPELTRRSLFPAERRIKDAEESLVDGERRIELTLADGTRRVEETPF